MDIQNNFDEIRPYNDEEVHTVLSRLVEEPSFVEVVKKAIPFFPFDQLKQTLLSIHTKKEFQIDIMVEIIKYIMKSTTNGVKTTGWENIDKDNEYLFISNHRDIVLDSALLSAELSFAGRNTCEIAIGDNLLIFPWISDLVRLNKNFIVKRGVGIRQMLEASKLLSSYIHYARTQKHESIWIAQREGRAKDSNDRTQEALIKMLNLGGESDSIIENIMNLNIAPLSITYEYDPCDYLKAKEFQLKRDNPDYKKEQSDDLINMRTGIMEPKGHVFFHVSPCINDTLATLPKELDKTDTFAAIAAIIDQAIHANYHIFPHNYVALDYINGNNELDIHYTDEQKDNFYAYVEKQIQRIDIPNKDTAYLTHKIMEMYANPLKNYMTAKSLL